jgi:hypothetical protein
VITHMDVKMSNETDVINDLVYLNPMFLEQTKENPFKIEDRKYPVDFPYLMDRTYVAKITLPEGYSIHQIPKPLVIKLPNNAASYQYNINKQGNIMQLTCKFKINKNFFGVEEYPQLREFFNQIIKIESEPVVLKKN